MEKSAAEAKSPVAIRDSRGPRRAAGASNVFHLLGAVGALALGSSSFLRSRIDFGVASTSPPPRIQASALSKVMRTQQTTTYI